MKNIALQAKRNGYGPEQVNTITVGELRELLLDCDDNDKVYFHTGHLYGANWYGISPEIRDEEKYDEED